MKTFLAVLFGALCIFGIVECTRDHLDAQTIKDGVVCDKTHHAGYYQTTYTPDGNGGLIPIMYWVDPTWSIEIAGTSEKGRVKSRTVSVSESLYSTTEIGAPWNEREGVLPKRNLALEKESQ